MNYFGSKGSEPTHRRSNRRHERRSEFQEAGGRIRDQGRARLETHLTCVPKSSRVKHDHGLTRLVEVRTNEQTAMIRELFREYANSLNIDLCFQGFEAELAELPGRYAHPSGQLLLAVHGNDAAGCVGLRPTGADICEMKRLYVRPLLRGKRIGRALAEGIITVARRLGYAKMRLDSLSSMEEAISLYESLGFTRIAPYYANPNDGAIFMELKL